MVYALICWINITYTNENLFIDNYPYNHVTR
ncbi:hypothetical protein SAMN06298216_4161 [Spirosomataceae bacterium TFI 002]|nr:hypothetical protein SAMN06298216_4161 [Spirosomataceae bacterium TFI 002]